MDTFYYWLDYLRDLHILSIFVRFSFAVLCGGIIGMERGKKRQAAGLRTHLLVCLGSASVMMVSQYMSITINPNADPARLGAQVISGIGFLGVGTIVVTGHNQVKGLTTAAGLWASACMGLAIGIGFYEGALIMCLFIYLVLEVISRLDDHYLKSAANLQLYIEYEKGVHFSSVLKLLRELGWHAVSIERFKEDGSDCNNVLVSLTRSSKVENRVFLISSLKEVVGVLYVEEM